MGAGGWGKQERREEQGGVEREDCRARWPTWVPQSVKTSHGSAHAKQKRAPRCMATLAPTGRSRWVSQSVPLTTIQNLYFSILFEVSLDPIWAPEWHTQTTENERHAARERSRKTKNERHAAWRRSRQLEGPDGSPKVGFQKLFKTFTC